MQKRDEPVVCVVCAERPKPQQMVKSEPVLTIKRENSDVKRHQTTLLEDKQPKRAQTEVEQTIRNKIEWANRELLSTDNVKSNTELCELIKSATDALISLGRLNNQL